MTEEEKTKLYIQIHEETRKNRYKCSQVCATWNREDHDCEIYGYLHPSPSNCHYYITGEAEKRMKEKEKKELI